VLRMLNDGILELFSQIKILTIWKNAQRNGKGGDGMYNRN